MTKRNDKQKLQQQRKKANKDSAREKQKFWAWLGEILATGMSQEDFVKAQNLYKQGISVQQVQKTLEKPYKRAS